MFNIVTQFGVLPKGTVFLMLKHPCGFGSLLLVELLQQLILNSGMFEEVNMVWVLHEVILIG